jgi:pyruvate dehydrogenase E1 component beta subunit
MSVDEDQLPTLLPSVNGYVDALKMALDEALSGDPSVVLLGEDIADEQGGGVMKVTLGLSSRYGTDRVRTTPISEQAIIGAAIGAALGGLRPVAELMLMNFVSVAMDQIFNHAAKLRFMSGGQTGVPITIRTATGAGFGFGAQHSDMLEGWLAHAPGLKVVLPSTPADAKGLLLSCIFDDDPCIFVEHAALYFGAASGPAPEPGARVPIGVARTVREGTDLTVVGYGKPILDAAAVAAELDGEGISIEVVDLRTVSPWDEAAVLASVAKTRRAVVVHESVQQFGPGGEIASRINEELFGQLDAAVLRVGAPSCPVPYSNPLEMAYVPGVGRIEQAIRQALK